MLLSFLSLLFLLLAVRGFAHVIRYFWNWLRDGEKVDDPEAVAEAAEARAAAESVAVEGLEDLRDRRADRDLTPVEAVTGAARTATGAIGEYLDNMHLGWWQVVMVFFIGCIAGLMLEEVWMFLTAGLTESRVGLVWGPFSPLYGFGAALLTVACFWLRRHHARGWQVFLLSVVIGGTLEQVTGWSMETLFHAQSWTYLHLPDHITQWVAWRFLFFWGLLGLMWFRFVMPPLLVRIGMPTTRRQAIFLTLLVAYLVADIGMTVACFTRATARAEGVPAHNAFEEWVDEHYTNEFIANRFQNLTMGEGA